MTAVSECSPQYNTHTFPPGNPVAAVHNKEWYVGSVLEEQVEEDRWDLMVTFEIHLKSNTFMKPQLPPASCGSD